MYPPRISCLFLLGLGDGKQGLAKCLIVSRRTWGHKFLISLPAQSCFLEHHFHLSICFSSFLNANSTFSPMFPIVVDSYF